MRARFLWWWCWAIYKLYMALPWVIAQHCMFMLPTVGAYAYSDDFEDFKTGTSYFN